MRYFLNPEVPNPRRVLLIESGARGVAERLLAVLPQLFPGIEVDVVTCYVGEPLHFSGQLFNINEYGGPGSREKLLADLLARNYQLVGLMCTGEPIMTKWKWWLSWKLPSKIFIANENGDFFWFDRGHVSLVGKLMLDRAGLTGGAAVPAIARLLFLPFTVLFLLTYAGSVHLRRRLRTS